MPLWIPSSGGSGTPIGISTQGNTSGTTGFATAGSYQFVASNLLTLSQSITAGSATMTLVGPRIPSLTRFDNAAVAGSVQAYTSLGTLNGSMHLWPLAPLNDVFPANMTASTLFLDVRGSGSSANSAAATYRASVGIYTMAGASSLSLLNSGSASWTAAATTNQSTLWDGLRWLSIGSAGFSTQLSFSQTSYWLGLIMSSSGQSQSMSFNGQYLGMTASSRNGTFGGASGTAASAGWEPWTGIVATAALPVSIPLNGVTKTGVSGGFVPHTVLEAQLSAW